MTKRILNCKHLKDIILKCTNYTILKVISPASEKNKEGWLINTIQSNASQS